MMYRNERKKELTKLKKTTTKKHDDDHQSLCIWYLSATHVHKFTAVTSDHTKCMVLVMLKPSPLHHNKLHPNDKLGAVDTTVWYIP